MFQLRRREVPYCFHTGHLFGVVPVRVGRERIEVTPVQLTCTQLGRFCHIVGPKGRILISFEHRLQFLDGQHVFVIVRLHFFMFRRA